MVTLKACGAAGHDTTNSAALVETTAPIARPRTNKTKDTVVPEETVLLPAPGVTTGRLRTTTVQR